MNFKSIFVYPKYPENLKRLYELACNLWSVWDYEARGLFYRIDTRLFREVEHNPVKLLHSLSKERLQALAADKGFLFELEKVWERFQQYLQYAGTFKDKDTNECSFEPQDIIAYFSMEFALHESIPTYAGGLGVLSGDFLKAASDMDLPVIGVGILYKCGYFSQHIDFNGNQMEVCDKLEYHLIPVRELRDSQGNPAHVTVKVLDQDVKVKLWKIDVGKTTLILLDTDIEDNPPHLRDITGELYADDREKRIQQELILGLGGIKALEMLAIKVKVYHLNEGHSAFAIVARLQDLMVNNKLSFSEAKAVIRASTVFTTHTPVIAGNENFDFGLAEKYLMPYVKQTGLSVEHIRNLAQAGNSSNAFWMPALAIRFSRYVNAVSKQHVQMARKMWAGVFPERPVAELPIFHITNGVHLSWISPPFIDLFNRYLGPDYLCCGDKEHIWENIYNIPDEELWAEHRRNKKDMVNFIKRRLEQMVAGQYSQTEMLKAGRSLNTDYLTIVFARRFASYKRPTLILRDKERFRKILTNPAKPVQMIFAGKAYPTDQQSKQMIKEIVDFARQYGVEDRVLFLENYDLNIARHLHWGADVWLNNPAQNMEASGTSGMKASMNGVLHLSTLEGWWPEGYDGKNGWAIIAGREYSTAELQETADANQLYDLLENQITDLYYNRGELDIPDLWVGMMKEAMFSVCRNFNMNRMLCDYLKKCYIPAKNDSARILNNDRKLLKNAIQQEQQVLKHWDNIGITSFSIEAKKGHLTEGEHIRIECGVRFDDAEPALFSVELFYIYGQKDVYKVLPMETVRRQDNTVYYEHLLKIEGYGAQHLNVRIKPANEIVQDIHPELIKWKD